MLVIKNIEKIDGFKYNKFYTIINGIEEDEYYSFWLEYEVGNVIHTHDFPILLYRHPNHNGLYKLSYKHIFSWIEKEKIQSIDNLIEEFRKL